MLRAVFVQMAGNSVVDVPRCDKLVRAVRLMAFVTTAIEERAGFVSVADPGFESRGGVEF